MRRRIQGVGRGLLASLGMLVIALVAVVLVLLVWPTDEVRVAGVSIDVGAQRPDPGFGLSGPGQLESFGQTVDIRAVDVTGPVRPLIRASIGPYDLITIATTSGAPQRAGHDLVVAFTRWALLRTPAVIGTGVLLYLLAVAVGTFAGRLPPVRPANRGRYTSWGGATAVVVTMVWGTSLALATAGSSSIARVESLDDVFDYDVLRTSPPPEGVPRTGYDIVVIGDSRAAVYGGEPEIGRSEDDVACHRSRDSLAGQVEQLLRPDGVRALNLTCLSATVDDGLLTSQLIGGRRIPAQLGQLKLVDSPEVVVVSVGPNDVYWGPIVGACYVSTCNVTGLAPTVDNAFAQFSRSYDDLLSELDGLDPSPQVIVVGSYQPFQAGATCDDTRIPDGSGSVSESEIVTIRRWADRLNTVLGQGAARHDDTFVLPDLLPYCTPDTTGLGPDIWPLASEFRFHPTSVGVLKTATAVVGAVDRSRLTQDPQVGEGAAGPG